MLGLMVVLWLGGLASGRVALLVAVAGVALIVLSHTRTALVGMVAGLLVAGLSLIVAKARARKFFAAAGVVASIGVITVAGVVTTWLARGQSDAAASIPHWADRLLGAGSQLATRQIPGDLRFRPLERVVQWPPDRQ